MERGPVGGVNYWANAALPGFKRISSNAMKALWQAFMHMQVQLIFKRARQRGISPSILEVRKGSREVVGSQESHRR